MDCRLVLQKIEGFATYPEQALLAVGSDDQTVGDF
jgi:hypothetical protein